MKILVLGSGAREHAIVKALVRTGTTAANVVCAPGNAGIAQDVTCVALNANDPVAVVAYATTEKFDLAIIGPEAVDVSFPGPKGCKPVRVGFHVTELDMLEPLEAA